MKVDLDSLALELASWMPPLRRPGGVRVLCYHGVYDGGEPPPGDRFGITTRALADHVAAILDTDWAVLQPTDLEQGGAGSVLLTFDDNLVSHVACALPILRAAGITATFYLTPGELGAAGRLSHQGVRALLGAGMFVGAHGNHHIPAVRIGPAEFQREVLACRGFLQGLGMPLTWAYPGGYIGSFRDYHERILLDYGFAIRFTTLEGVYRPSSQHAQSRYVIRRCSSGRYVRAALRGGLQFVRFGKRVRALVESRLLHQA
jgi:peptidoglycan/xylan/chitin deacetylase (PgdA/CDA1 family)